MLQKGKGSLRRIVTPIRARSSQAFARLLGAFSVLQRNVSKSVLPRIGVVLAITSVIALGSTLFGRLPQAQAATSSTITFQGRLLSNTGTTVPDGSYNMQFNLYTVASGGSTQWTDSRLVNATQGIVLKNGYFSVNLADTSVGGTAFPSTINWDQEQWLGLTVRGTNSCTPFSSCASPADAEMTPRFKLTAVPYAFSAGQLQQTNGASTLKVQTATPTANVTYTFQDATTGTYNVCTSANNCTGLGAYIQNQNAGQQSASNFWISGTGRADTSFTTPALERAVAGTLSVGTTATTTAMTIGSTSLTGTLAINSGAASTISVGSSASARTINIGNVAAVQTITIGSTNSTSTLTLQAGTGALNIQTQGTGGINIGTNAVSQPITIGNSTGGALRVGQNGGTVQIDGTNFDVSTVGVVTLAGGQTSDITTPTAATANAIAIKPGTSSGATSIGPALNLRAGDSSGTTSGTGGAATLSGGNATGGAGTRTGGGVSIDAGTGATANGAISIGTTNATTTTIGRTSATTVSIQGGTAINIGSGGVANTIQLGNTTGAVTQTINIGNNGTASSVTNIIQGSIIGASTTTIRSGSGGLLLQPTASNIVLGTVDATGTLLVIDTKNTAGDPTGVAGGIYYNSSTGTFRCYTSAWADCSAGGSGASKFTDAGTQTYLTATTDELVIGGTASLSAKLSVVGTADQEQLLIRANGTQSNSNAIIRIETSAGAELLSVRAQNDSSIFIGANNGGSITSGTANIGIGSGTLTNVSSASENVAIGAYSQQAGNAGQNTSLGTYTLSSGSLSGGQNTAIGGAALQQNTTGTENVALGRVALYGNLGGAQNTALGNAALNGNISGNQNVAVGNGAGLLSTGTGNIFVGFNAGSNLTSGGNNIIIGNALNASAAGVSNELRIGGVLQGSTSTLAAQFNGALTVVSNLAVDTNTLFVDATNNRVGIGNAIPTSTLYVEKFGTSDTFITNIQSSSASTSTQTTLNVANAASPGSASTAIYYGGKINIASSSANLTGGGIIGLENQAAFSATGSILYSYGADSYSYNASTGTINNAFGVQSRIYNQTTGSIGTAYASNSFVQNASTGVITTANGYHTKLINAGTVTTSYGLEVENPQNTGTIGTARGVALGDLSAATGTITNRTNLLIGTGTTGNWSIYNNSSYNNYFQGNLRIGTAGTPNAPLDIVSAAATSIRVTAGASWPLILQQDTSSNFTINNNNSTNLTILGANGNVGVGTTLPISQFSAGQQTYSTGTASQSGTTLTGVGTTFTYNMNGGLIVFANGTTATLTDYISATQYTVTPSQTVTSQAYTIYYGGLQVKSTGTTAAMRLLVTGNTGDDLTFTTDGTFDISSYANVAINLDAGGATSGNNNFRINNDAAATVFDVDETGLTQIAGNLSVKGDATPLFDLTVGADEAVTIAGVTTQAGIFAAGSAGLIVRDTTNDSEFYINSNAFGTQIGTSTASPLVIRTDATNRITIASTGNIQLGATDATGNVLGLDIKNTAGDPTGVTGGMYYNSNSNSFRCYTTSWADCQGAGASKFTDAGAYTYLTATADRLIVGSSSDVSTTKLAVISTNNANNVSTFNTQATLTTTTASTRTYNSWLNTDIAPGSAVGTNTNYSVLHLWTGVTSAGRLDTTTDIRKIDLYTEYNSSSAETIGSATNIYTSDVVNTNFTISNFRGVQLNDPGGAGTITANTALNIANQTKGTNNTNLLVGTTTIPSGNYSIYNNSTYNNLFGGSILANNSSAGVARTTEATARTNVTTVTITVAGYANGDVIYINNAGQDYYTRITAGGGTTTLTVSPAVSYDVSAAVTSWNVQNIGASATDYTTQTNRFFQGYFLGGVVTGAGSTTLSDGLLRSTGSLTLQTNGSNTRLTVDTSGRVGIGTTALSAPGGVLTVKALSGESTVATLHTNDYVNASTGSSLAILFGASSGNTYTELAALSTGGTTWNNLILQRGGGNVGIGTVSPGARLELNPGIDLRPGGVPATANMFRMQGGQGASIWGQRWDTDITGIDTNFSRLTFSGGLNSSGSYVMTQILGLSSAGNVSIGTRNSTQMLYVTAANAVTTSVRLAAFNVSGVEQSNLTLNSTTTASETDITFNSGAGATGLSILNGAGNPIFKFRGDGYASTHLGNASAGTNALCSSLANATAPTLNTLYLIRDCNAAPAADFAEMYPAAGDVELADVVMIGSSQVDTYNWDASSGEVNWNSVKGKIRQVVKATNAPYSSQVFGVVSDNYLDFGSIGHNIKEADNPTSIALVGRVNVKVSTENGSIAAGDFLTASATLPGYAMKATQAGYVIGQALDDYTATQPGEVMVFVKVQYYGGTQAQILNGTFDNLQVMGVATLSSASIVNNLTVGGTLTVTGSASFTSNLAVAGTATLANLVVTGDTVVTKLTVNGKIITGGAVPTVTSGTAAGTGGSVAASIVGNDTAGTFSITTGTSSLIANDILGEVTFTSPYSQAPVVTVSPTTEESASIRYFLIKTPTGWSIKTLDTPQANKTYSFDYHVIQ